MQIAGIIVEYNPMHSGHLHLLEETRRLLGADTAIVCAMSGDFVQRGDFALFRRQARARAAVESGVDLVLELPLPWAISSAERFADGGVQTLLATGLVTHLAFGSECGNASGLMRVAEALLSDLFPTYLREELERGDSFAAARQRAAERMTRDAVLLERPNNTLGVEYCKSLLRYASSVQPLTIFRRGAAHDGGVREGENPSASAIRTLIQAGERDKAMELMLPSVKDAYKEEEAAGRAPVFGQTCERAVLARLRSMSEADFAALDEGREGLFHRLYDASRTAVSISELLETVKTRRYPYARLRRMILWAWLGLSPSDMPEKVPYLRVLAANRTGCELLARMRQTASVPILTKPGHIRRLSPEAQIVFDMEVRAADLYALAYPDLTAARGGSIWRERPVILQ